MRNSELWAVGDAHPYNQTECMSTIVGDGSRLPTRSNRKAIATGNLRPRRPEHTNKRHNIMQKLIKNRIPEK